MAASTPDSDSVYFPLDTINGNSGILEGWANKVLFNLKEPDLKSYAGKGDFFRLIWLRAFENPIIMRMNRFGDTAYVTLKENDFSLSSSEKPQLLKDTIVNIGSNEYNQFIDQINKGDYWNSPYNDSIPGKDGATWFLECRLNGKYKVIQRWDDGYLNSKDLNKYLSAFIQEMNKYIELKSSR